MFHRVVQHSEPRLVRYLISLLLVLSLFGCGSVSSPNQYATMANNLRFSSDSEVTHQFLKVFDEWQGAPYRLGGVDKYGVDCSAFVQIAFRDAIGVSLERTTLRLSLQGHNINYEQASPGDLVFFKTSPKVRHVGVYLGDNQFMHASTSKGVIISRMDNPYWAGKFWQFRRVTERPPMTH